MTSTPIVSHFRSLSTALHKFIAELTTYKSVLYFCVITVEQEAHHAWSEEKLCCPTR